MCDISYIKWVNHFQFGEAQLQCYKNPEAILATYFVVKILSTFSLQNDRTENFE